ncbi:MAG: translation initiation factor IF-2 [bacterium]|nr:translation initiation factor IF-2 [bacterium]
MLPRSPVVAILGHVDHGKTSLLDFIRKSQIASKEHGGITQRIGGYEIETDLKDYKVNKITFIDTPGHEAFSQLRARGAQVADIALLIIDGKDSIMPQTIESISHIKNAKIPFIVVINKIDLPDVNPEKVKNDLLKYEVMVEGKGGNTPFVLISAKSGKGVADLIENILLLATDLNLNYDPNHDPKAYIIETKHDKRGVVACVIIKDGIMKIGDVVYNRDKKIKIKAMISDLGTQLLEATPSTPFELLGFNEQPEVGSEITKTLITDTEKEKDSIISQKIDMNAFLHPEIEKKLSLVIKADSQGSLEAISFALDKNTNIDVILKAVGEVNKSDIFLAKTTKAIVIGFGVKVNNDVVELAKQEKVIIKTYNIIYKLLDELNEVADLMKEKEEKEKYLKGEAKILATFVIEREKIFGVKVTKGKIHLGDDIELYRVNNLIGKTKLVSLKIRAKIVEEVKKEQEGGMVFGPPLDIQVGDVVKSIS